MTSTAITIDGNVRPDGSLEVNGQIALAPGPVRVTVEPAPIPADGLSVVELLNQFAQEQAASSVRPRTREEVDAELDALRDEAEEEVLAIERLQEELRRGREA